LAEIEVDDVKIRPADAAGRHVGGELAGAAHGHGHVPEHNGPADRSETIARIRAEWRGPDPLELA